MEYSVYLAVKSATTSTQVLLLIKDIGGLTRVENLTVWIFSGRHQDCFLLPIPVGLCQGLLWSICSGYKITLLKLKK